MVKTDGVALRYIQQKKIMKNILLIIFCSLLLCCKKENTVVFDMTGVWKGSYKGGTFQPISFVIKKNNVIEFCSNGICPPAAPEITGVWEMLDPAAFKATFKYPNGEVKEIFGAAESDGKGMLNTYLASSLTPGAAKIFWIVKE
jgi:hypothetical protein